MELSKEERQRIALDYLQELQGSNPAKLTKLDAGNSFVANGKLYTVSHTFAIGRFSAVEELEEELIALGDKLSCHQVMLSAMAQINQINFGGAYTTLFNKIESDQRNARLTHYMLRMCAAYINYEGEDVRYLTEEVIKAKMNDWSEEGLPVLPFYSFAVSVCNAAMERYRKPLAHLLNEAKEMSAAIAEVLDITNFQPSLTSGLEASLDDFSHSKGTNAKSSG